MLGIWDIYNIKQKNHEISHRSLELREKECLLLGIAKRLVVNQFEAPSPPAEQIWMQKAPGVPVTENIVFDFVLWILFQSVLSVIVLSNNFSNILESEGIFLTLATQRQALCWNIYWFVGQGYYLISCTSRWRWKRRKINVLRDLEENMCNFSPREHFFKTKQNKTKQNKTKRKKTKQNSKQKKFHE